jgi:hypothetical protein
MNQNGSLDSEEKNKAPKGTTTNDVNDTPNTIISIPKSDLRAARLTPSLSTNMDADVNSWKWTEILP